MSDDDELLLLDDGFDACLDDSPVVAVEYFVFDGPAVDGDVLESFGLLVEVLEELLNENKFRNAWAIIEVNVNLP